jgi:hypothetical protein
MLLSCQTLKGNRSGGRFFITRRHKGHEGFLGGIARVYLTTEYTEHTERRSSAVSREGAKARRLEGECPHEPPSTVRKDGFRVCCGALGGASVCLPADEQTLVPPQRRSRRHPVKKSLSLCVSALKNFQRSTLISALTSKAKDLECGGKRYSARRRFLSSVFPCVARRESGAATRAQRGSCHRTPNFPPRHARHNLYAPACQSCRLCARVAGNPVKKTPCFSPETHDPRPPCH